MSTSLEYPLTEEQIVAFVQNEFARTVRQVWRQARAAVPPEEQNWGFVKSVVIIAADAYGPHKCTPGSRQLAKMRRAVPFFLDPLPEEVQQ